MNVKNNLSLAKLTTMRVGGPAQYLVEVTTPAQAVEALTWARQKNLDFFVLGGGSNTIFTDSGFQGLVILNKIKLKGDLTPNSPVHHVDKRGAGSPDVEGSSSNLSLSLGSGFVLEEGEDGYILSSGSGENWDELVKFSVENGLTGIEALSLIPGTVGAAPVQNIGAYGQQVSDSIFKLEAIDTKTLEKVQFGPEDCNFSYRSSRFNQQDKGRYLITKVQVKLKEGAYSGKFYKDVEAYLKLKRADLGSYLSSAEIREAVIAIRSNKLPDPREVANAGSFFKNPIVSEDQFAELKLKDAGILKNPPGWSQPPFWKTDSGYKISAGWLVGRVGFSSFYSEELGFGTWPKQNLVLYSKSSNPEYANLKKFKDEIKLKVQDKFGISLSQEPEEVVE